MELWRFIPLILLYIVAAYAVGFIILYTYFGDGWMKTCNHNRILMSVVFLWSPVWLPFWLLFYLPGFLILR